MLQQKIKCIINVMGDEEPTKKDWWGWAIFIVIVLTLGGTTISGLT